MATFAMIGIGSGALPMAAAQQAAEVDVERNNEINQEIKQKQEACTNELEGGLSGEIDQDNDCLVTQTQNAANVGTILDESENEFDVESILADVGLDL